MADEEVRITASMNDDLSGALTRVGERIKHVEDEAEKLGAKGKAAGKAAASGMNDLGDAADKAGRKSETAGRQMEGAGRKAAKAGAEAAIGSEGLKKFGEAADKAGKKAGGLGSIFTALKFSGIITGVFALAGGVSALAAGAVIAIGGLAPMVGVLAGALPIMAAVKLSMLAFKLAATELKPTLDGIKNQFTALGPVIANGGLKSGLDYFSRSIHGLVKITGTGLAGLGAEIGGAAREAGNIAKSAPFLNQVSTIFAGLRPIVHSLALGLLAIGQAMLNVMQAAMPAAQLMAAFFLRMANGLRDWTAAQLASGKMTEFISNGWVLLQRVGGVVVDVLIGLFNIFRIGAGYAGGMGDSIEAAATKFRLWTGSEAGVARITKYFQDSLPALQEMGKLLGMAAGGLLAIGGNQNVAPLLAQIRTELAPALGQLVTNLSGQGGLGPALIDAATALANLFAGMDFSALTMFVQGLASILQSLVWISANVPGASFVISGLLGALIGIKLLGPVFGLIGKGADAFNWMGGALKETEKLSGGQKVFAAVVKPVGEALSTVGKSVLNFLVPALRTIAIVGVGALRTLSTALLTTPVGWVILAIMAIVGIIVLLWMKCAWFRDAVRAVWEAIKVAAMAVWNAIKVAISAVVDFFVAYWTGASAMFQSIINGIVDIAMWIWTHGIKPVVDFILWYWGMLWDIVKTVVQTAVYVIVGIFTLIAVTAKYAWEGIVAIAQWAWNTILLPIFQFIGFTATAMWQGVLMIAQIVWNAIVATVQWVWNTILLPIFQFIGFTASAMWQGILIIAQFVWNAIVAVVQWVWTTFLQPVFTTIGSAGSALWSVISSAASAVWGVITSGWNAVWGFLSGIWDKLKGAGTGVWDAIKSAASAVGDVVKGVWNGIVDTFKGVWNWIAKGWNNIPDIHVPDWIPLIGGKTFGLPKLPLLWHGGEAPGGVAIVGEHGPEPLVVGGQFAGMVGQNGPEIAKIPAGGYVVPNLATLSALPGLAKSIPAGVASAVARSVPGYAPAVASSGNGALAREVRNLASAVAAQPPPIYATSSNVRAEVEDALRTIRREDAARGRYDYGRG